MPFLEAKGVSKEYVTPSGSLPVLSDVNLVLDQGEAISIMGPSGSGKGTLLHILGALDPPSAGSVTLNGTNPFLLREREQSAFRNRQVGFVFQDHALLPQCSVLENILLPTLVARDAGSTQRAQELIHKVGLSSRVDHLPWQLSGGEKQRAAIARALIREPHLVLCDEPTGNLDEATAESVAELLLGLSSETILIVVTHNAVLARKFSRSFAMRDKTLHEIK